LLSKSRVLQTIEQSKRKLELGDMGFAVTYAEHPPGSNQRAEILIRSDSQAEIVLYPDATLFSVRHELCHAKLFRMGAPLTNTEKDRKLFPDSAHYLRAIVIAEWYVNELQRKVFGEYYAADRSGAPRAPPYPGLPKLPTEGFTAAQIRRIFGTAKGLFSES
jgi:hypothetical protein